MRGSRRQMILSSFASVCACALGAAACGGTNVDWAGARLGMSASDVRDRFRPGSEGTWSHALEPEPVLRWVAKGPDAPIKRATFELHAGMLVALTVVGGDLTKGRAFETTRGSVVARRTGADGPEVRVISRDCETHRAEVQRLLAGAR